MAAEPLVSFFPAKFVIDPLVVYHVVAVPLTWNELGEEPPRFLVTDFAAWSKRLRRDPWKEMLNVDQRLKLG